MLGLVLERGRELLGGQSGEPELARAAAQQGAVLVIGVKR